MSAFSRSIVAPLFLGSLTIAPAVHAQRGRGGPVSPADSTVPANLRSLLAPKRSEMRLVIQRYANDHTLLAGNYAGGQPAQGGGGRAGGGGRGGRGGADSTSATDSPSGRAGGRGGRGGGPVDLAAEAIPVSKDRIARLKRYDLSWQAALDRL